MRRVGIDNIDLLKVDIEGAEIPMLDACSDEALRSISQITIEFHDFCGLTPLREVRRVVKRLCELGFRSIRFSRVGHQDTWLVNTAKLNVGHLQFAYWKYCLCNLRGGVRLARKLALGDHWAEEYS